MCIQHAFLDEKPTSPEGLFPQSVKKGRLSAHAPQCLSGRTQMEIQAPRCSRCPYSLVEDFTGVKLNDSLNQAVFRLTSQASDARAARRRHG